MIILKTRVAVGELEKSEKEKRGGIRAIKIHSLFSLILYLVYSYLLERGLFSRKQNKEQTNKEGK